MKKWIAGVDEAGRGPLAGPVCASAVILDTLAPDLAHLVPDLTDSKKLSEKKRNDLYDWICEHADAYAIAYASVDEIDELNIRQASLLAMRRAVDQLSLTPTWVQVDGRDLPKWPYPGEAIIGGDLICSNISAASILAKVSRDRLMLDLHSKYPCYGFDAHKGYPTAQHIKNIRQFGPSDIHRKSFGPVKKCLQMTDL